MKENGHPSRIGAIGIRAAIITVLIVAITLFPEPQPYVDALSEGHVLRASGQHRAALAAFQRAHAMQPRAIAPLAGVARADIDLGRSGESLPVFREIVEAGEPPIDILISWGQAYYSLGDIERAIQLWHQACQRDGPEAHYWLGTAYLDLGEWAEAVDHLRAALSSGRVSNEIVQKSAYRLALALAFDDSVQAVEVLKQATIGSDPAITVNASVLLQTLRQAQADDRCYDTVLAAGLFNLGEYGQAELHLHRALQNQPDDADALAYLGAITGARGSAEEAGSLLGRALVLDDDHALAMYFLGRLQLQQGDIGEARSTFGRLLALDPQNAAVCAEIARTYLAGREYALAEQWFEAAVESAPLSADFYYVLADFEAGTLFDLDKGLEAIQEAVEIEPTNPAAYDMLGWLRYLLRDWADAETALYRALELEPKRASTYYHLGRLYEGTGKRDAARWAFGRAVDLGAGQPSRRAAEDALKRLGPGAENPPAPLPAD